VTTTQGITLVGRKLLDAKLALLPHKVRRQAVLKPLRPAGPILKKNVKALAPQGQTGNLKRSIRVRTLRGQPPAVSVHPTYKIAPHKHLVHEGTTTRFRTRIGGRFAYVRNPTPAQLSTGRAKPNPFFTRAWKAVQSQVLNVTQDKLWKVVRESSLRGGRR